MFQFHVGFDFVPLNLDQVADHPRHRPVPVLVRDGIQNLPVRFPGAEANAFITKRAFPHLAQGIEQAVQEMVQELIPGGLCESQMKLGVFLETKASALYRIMLPPNGIFEHGQLRVRRALCGEGGDLGLENHARLEEVDECRFAASEETFSEIT